MSKCLKKQLRPPDPEIVSSWEVVSGVLIPLGGDPPPDRPWYQQRKAIKELASRRAHIEKVRGEY